MNKIRAGDAVAYKQLLNFLMKMSNIGSFVKWRKPHGFTRCHLHDLGKRTSSIAES